MVYVYNFHQNMKLLKNISEGPCNSLGHTEGYKYGVRSSKFIWAHEYSCTRSLAETPQLPPPPRMWAHIRGRYWSAKIDDISL
jgi:hypothetical protein